jgi:hypothetical protein
MDEMRFLVGPPLDGYVVVANYTFTGAGDETMASPHRYAVNVYRLNTHFGGGAGYLQVLRYITTKAYPAEAHDVIDAELPIIRRLLTQLYPQGPPS